MIKKYILPVILFCAAVFLAAQDNGSSFFDVPVSALEAKMFKQGDSVDVLLLITPTIKETGNKEQMVITVFQNLKVSYVSGEAVKLTLTREDAKKLEMYAKDEDTIALKIVLRNITDESTMPLAPASFANMFK